MKNVDISTNIILQILKTYSSNVVTEIRTRVRDTFTLLPEEGMFEVGDRVEVCNYSESNGKTGKVVHQTHCCIWYTPQSLYTTIYSNTWCKNLRSKLCASRTREFCCILWYKITTVDCLLRVRLTTSVSYLIDKLIELTRLRRGIGKLSVVGVCSE